MTENYDPTVDHFDMSEFACKDGTPYPPSGSTTKASCQRSNGSWRKSDTLKATTPSPCFAGIAVSNTMNAYASEASRVSDMPLASL
jgi:hypothetical protein